MDLGFLGTIQWLDWIPAPFLVGLFITLKMTEKNMGNWGYNPCEWPYK